MRCLVPSDFILRDVRLITIWTGTDESMDLVVQSEFYKEFLAEKPHGCDVDADVQGVELPGGKTF